MSNLQSKHPNFIQVYDSLYKKAGGRKLKRQISTLSFMFLQNHDNLVIEYMNVQRQVGGDDCGLFTVAFATSLCHSVDPLTCRFKQKEMREHFLRCLLNEYMTPFPYEHKRLGSNAVISAEHIPIYCILMIDLMILMMRGR